MLVQQSVCRQRIRCSQITNMKKQTSIIILTCSVLLAITNPVNAKNHKVGDVFYCESEAGAYVHAPDYELIRWKNFKFRFKIENSQVIR